MQAVHKEVHLNLKGEDIHGNLTIPPNSKALVVFAHGSGSSRFSTRNRFVAGELNKAGLSTLLMDLLSKREEYVDDMTAEIRFNIPFLAKRLNAVTDEAIRMKELAGFSVGYFGASTGGGAAIQAAAERNDNVVRAIVSRGGRPDLASNESLQKCSAPTLLIIGGRDTAVIEMNNTAYAKMVNCKDKQIEIVSGATHLFEEPGALNQVAALATEFFVDRLLKKLQGQQQQQGAMDEASLHRAAAAT